MYFEQYVIVCERTHLTFTSLMSSGGLLREGRPWPTRVEQALEADKLDKAKFLSWTFVRDPLDRFISLYNSIRPVGHWGITGERQHLCTWACNPIWSGEHAGASER